MTDAPHFFGEYFKDSEEIFYEIGLSGVINYLSPSVSLFSKYTSKELIGQSILNLFKEPSSRTEFLEAIGKTGRVKNYELVLKDKDGKDLFGILNARIIYNEKQEPEIIIGTLRDNSLQVKIQTALKESEFKHRVLLENAGVHILYVSPTGKIILINKMAAMFTGIKPDNLIDKHLTEIYAENHAQKFLEEIDKTIENKKGDVVEFETDFGKEKFWFISNFQPVINDHGAISGIIIISNDITERKRVETEMQKLSLVVEQSTALIQITDAKGNIEYINPRYSEVSGYSLKEIVGQTANFYSGKFIDKLIHKSIHENLKNGKTWEGEIKNQKKNGEYFWEKTIISPVYDRDDTIINYIAVKEDITENRIAKENEKKSKENLQILNETIISILTTKPEENIYTVIGNQLAKIIPDYIFLLNSFNEKLMETKVEFIHPGEGISGKLLNVFNLNILGLKTKPDINKYKKLKSGEYFNIDGGLYELVNAKLNVKLTQKIEKSFGMELFTCKGIVFNNNLLASFNIIKLKTNKICERDYLNTFLSQISIGLERMRLENQLIEAKVLAEEMSRIKSAFLANMSHELRTPLNGILGFSELLAEQSENEQQAGMLSVIHKSGLRLLDTLNTILDFTTIESHDIVLNYTKENIPALVREAISMYSGEAEQKGLSLNLVVKPIQLDGFIVKNLYQKTLFHIVKNAVKFTTKGKVTITLHLKSDKTFNWLITEIKDTGIGIQDSEIEHIFDEFRQGSEGLTRKFEGTGLGLTICKKFTEIMGGYISVNSKINKGSVFTLKTPIYRTDPASQDK